MRFSAEWRATSNKKLSGFPLSGERHRMKSKAVFRWVESGKSINRFGGFGGFGRLIGSGGSVDSAGSDG
jgi:hypothetical protein